jgi:serine/threonine protein kinase
MDDIRLRYIRLVGKGAFSSVWLARDEANSFSPYHQPHERRPSEVARRKRDRALDGLKPTNPRANLSFSGVNSKPAASWLSADPLSPRGLSMAEEGIEDDDLDVNMLEDGSTTPQDFIASAASRCGRLVAVKMMDIAACDANDRTRISFVREVEVLRVSLAKHLIGLNLRSSMIFTRQHISHPNIVSYLHSFTTPAHHCLVLEYIGGGELFDMVNTTDIYAKFTEPFIRRIWGELALAVGWMHNVCLVHRDIKLESK